MGCFMGPVNSLLPFTTPVPTTSSLRPPGDAAGAGSALPAAAAGDSGRPGRRFALAAAVHANASAVEPVKVPISRMRVAFCMQQAKDTKL